MNFFSLTLICLISISAQAQRSSVIYGDDDRTDIYAVKDPMQKRLTLSTVGLVSRGDLSKTTSGSFTLKTETFGSSMRLCKTERFYNQPVGAFCSGSLIGPNLILTAGHCIDSESSCQQTSFVFGFQMNSETDAVTTFPAANVVHCKKIISREEDGNGADYAVVEIDRTVTDFPILKLSNNSALKVGSPIVVIGHPSGLPVKIAAGANVRSLEDSDVGYFVANLDTYGGNSGSAVFNPESGEIEGVLVRGETDFVSNGMCRISYVCKNDECRGEDVTKASFIKQKLAALPRFSTIGFQGQNPRTSSNSNGGFQGRRDN